MSERGREGKWLIGSLGHWVIGLVHVEAHNEAHV